MEQESQHTADVKGQKLKEFLVGSTCGFSKDAWYEAERAAVATTLITLPILRRLLVEYYE